MPQVILNFPDPPVLGGVPAETRGPLPSRAGAAGPGCWLHTLPRSECLLLPGAALRSSGPSPLPHLGWWGKYGMPGYT